MLEGGPMDTAVRAFAAFPPSRVGGRRGWPGGRPFPFHARPVAARFARTAVWRGLQALGVGPGDEVLMPSFHHGVEVETVRAVGARVRFYPVGPDLTCRPSQVAAAVGPATRVVYVVHYFGFAQPVAELRALCDARGLALFEDCALALLSAPGGVPLGSVGDAAAFCLYKTLPVPDGGLLVLKQEALRPAPEDVRAEPGRWLREAATLARALLRPSPSRKGVVRLPTAADAAPADRDRAGHPEFHPSQLAWPMSPVTTLLLRSFDLGEIRRRRRRHFAFWEETLGRALPPVAGPLMPGTCPLLYPVLVDDKEGLCQALAAQGLELHRWWFRRWGGAPQGACPQADDLRRRLVGFPVHQALDEAALERILRAVRRHLGS